MRGYGRDYDDGRNWIERAGDTVRGWFGGGHEYNRDYGGWQGGDWNRGGMSGRESGWNRGPEWSGGTGGYRTNNWSNTHSTRESMDRAGGYYGADYDRGTQYGRGGHDQGWSGGREWRGGGDYDRDFGYGRGGGMGGNDRDLHGGGMMRGRNVGGNTGSGMRGNMGRGSMGGGTSGGMRGGGMGRDAWLGADQDWEQQGGTHWGDYGRGMGQSRWESDGAGGVSPGRYFRGYGNGSTSGSGYEPL